jgi:hypothetical protein
MCGAKVMGDEIPETSSPPLPENEVFTFEVQAAEVKRSAKDSYAHLKLLVKDHPEHANYIVWEILPLPNEFLFAARLAETVESEKYPWNQALWQRYSRFMGFLAAIGCEIGQGVTLEESGEQKAWNVKHLLGRRFQAKATTEVYQGKARSRIGEYLPRIS